METRGQRELVVLLHGLGAHPVMLRPLARRLRNAGYDTIRFGYDSLHGSIEHVADRLRRTLSNADADDRFGTVNVVAHSLGSIVTRTALQTEAPSKLGRCVMLGPPNRGSLVATLFGPVLGWAVPVIPQLTTRPDSFVNRLDRVLRAPTGIVAATRDWLVTPSSARLESAEDFVRVHCGHGSLLFRADVAKLVVQFLRSGQFDVERNDALSVVHDKSPACPTGTAGRLRPPVAGSPDRAAGERVPANPC